MFILDGDFKQIWLVLTRRCPLRCSYCNFVTFRKEELPLEDWKKVLRMYPKASYTIFGGEPSLYRDFWALVDVLNKEDMDYTVSTTGIDFTEDQIVKLKSISISIDGLTGFKDSHTRRKSESGVGIVDILRCRDRVVDFCGITVTRDNISEVPAIVEFLRGSSFRVCINVVHTGNELGKGEWDICKPSVEQLIDLVQWIGKNYSSSLFADPFDYLKLLPTQGLSQTWRCKGESTLCIDSDGGFSPCYLVMGKATSMEEYRQIQRDCKGCFLNCFWMANEMPDLWRKVE